MSEDLIASLKAQVHTLTQEVAKLSGENAKRRNSAKDLRGQVEALTGERDKLAKDIKARGAPGSEGEELERLRGEVRSYKHREGLAALAYSSEVGLSKSVPVDRLMRLIDYKPAADEFDAKSVKQVLLALKDSDPYLFGHGGGAPETPAPGHGAGLSPGVASMGQAFGRGAPPSPVDASQLGEADMRDPVFMSQYHAKQRAAAGTK